MDCGRPGTPLRVGVGGGWFFTQRERENDYYITTVSNTDSSTTVRSGLVSSPQSSLSLHLACRPAPESAPGDGHEDRGVCERGSWRGRGSRCVLTYTREPPDSISSIAIPSLFKGQPHRGVLVDNWSLVWIEVARVFRFESPRIGTAASGVTCRGASHASVRT